MAVVPEPEPKPEPELPKPDPKSQKIILGAIEVLFDGDFSDHQTSGLVDIYLQQLTRAISERNPRHELLFEGYTYSINDYFVEIESIESGSVVAKIKLAGTLALGIYTGVAAYPSFKDGLDLIQKDFCDLVEVSSNHFKEHTPIDSPLKFKKFKVILRDEKEIIEFLSTA